MVGYDTNFFMAPKCETEYYEDLMRKKLLPKREISLENVLEKLSTIYLCIDTTD